MPSIHKSELIALAEAKAVDAALLLQQARYSNAYYLAGYAIEIGIKAIIAGEFQADSNLIDDLWSASTCINSRS